MQVQNFAREPQNLRGHIVFLALSFSVLSFVKELNEGDFTLCHSLNKVKTVASKLCNYLCFL